MIFASQVCLKDACNCVFRCYLSRMSFFSNLKRVFQFTTGLEGSVKGKRGNREFDSIRHDTDPDDFWEIIGELGDGAFGKVHKAQHRETSDLAAAKICKLEAEEDLEDFLVEIEILRACHHPNVLSLIEAYFHEGKLWMLLDYCDGGAVDSIMVDLDKPLTEPQIGYVAKRMMAGLGYLHSQRVIHRDLKAGNVLLTTQGGVKLADFGVSARNRYTLQKRNTFIGSPYWMAPEVVMCETSRDCPYDYRADVWSFGITMIEMAQVEPPNHELSPLRVLLKIQKGQPPTLDAPRRFSKQFNAFISRCLVKNPAERPLVASLITHPFLQGHEDPKPILDLLTEYKAEVIEETVEEEFEGSTSSGPTTTTTSSSHQHRPGPSSSSSSGGSSGGSLLASERRRSSDDLGLGQPGKRKAPPPPVTAPAAEKVSKKPPAPLPPVSSSEKMAAEEGSKSASKATPVEEPKSIPPSPQEPAPKPPRTEKSVEKTAPERRTEVSTKKATEEVTPKVEEVVPRDAQEEKTPHPKSSIVHRSPSRSPIPKSPQPQRSPPKSPVPKSPQVSRPSSRSSTEPSRKQDETDESSRPEQTTGSGIEVGKGVEQALEDAKGASVTPPPSVPSDSQMSQPSWGKAEPMSIQPDSLEDSLSELADKTKPLKFRTPKAPPAYGSAPSSRPGTPLDSYRGSQSLPSSRPGTPGGRWSSMVSIGGGSDRVVATSTTSRPSTPPSRPSTPSVSSRRDTPAQEKQLDQSHVSIVTVGGDAGDEGSPEPPQKSPSAPPNFVVEVEGTTMEATDVDTVILPPPTEENQAKVNVSVRLEKNEEAETDAALLTDGSTPFVRDQRGSPVIQDLLTDGSTPFGDGRKGSPPAVPDSVDKALPSTQEKTEKKQKTQTPKQPSPTGPPKQINQPRMRYYYGEEPVVKEEGEPKKRYSLNMEDLVAWDKRGTPESARGASGGSASRPHKGADDRQRKPSKEKNIVYHEGEEIMIKSTSSRGRVKGGKRSQSEAELLKAFQREDVLPRNEKSDTTLKNAAGTPAPSEASTAAMEQSTVALSVRSSDKDSNTEEFPPVRLRKKPPDQLGAKEGGKKRSKEEMAELQVKKKTRKRTRKFVVDGVTVTTTTSKVIYGDEDGRFYDDHVLRKQELRELKMLQKQEQKQYQDLTLKARLSREQQDRKFEQDMAMLKRQYDVDLDNLNRSQKSQVERAELQLEMDLKAVSKRIRADQEKELRAFREGLRQEEKLVKQELELIPKDRRKEMHRIRKEEVLQEHAIRERNFLEKLNDQHEEALKKLSEKHREKIALLEKQILQQKHQLLRDRESAVWELEERQIHDKHQLAKRQLKDIFFLQRHQMLIRHEKEMEQVKRVNSRREEELLKAQAVERRALPKRIREERKAREMMFRESIRISMAQLDAAMEREKVKKFQENETRRYKAEQQRCEAKQQRQLEDLRRSAEMSEKELESLQSEKKRMLMEHETAKLKQQEEEYSRELREWRSLLMPRKRQLEDEFAAQLKQQEEFYTMTSSSSSSSSFSSRGDGGKVTPISNGRSSRKPHSMESR
ncbi:unnamed protein product [Cyprideis torosa]|uniref:Uncharacterized protein n=1 Tax=Cyprideis torosa TaxID=163714 RepID=A0A7R8W473_9CRUS|nr:unnamed protein product [Cyprideis torosa]CAG0883888.1 unnamed protein product [Cyprideis torosa]